MATHFYVPKKLQKKLTLQERALMYLVDHHEAFPHTVRYSESGTITFYKLIF